MGSEMCIRDRSKCTISFLLTSSLYTRPFRIRFVWLFFLLEGKEPIKASKLSDALKAHVFRLGEEDIPVAEICRKAGLDHDLCLAIFVEKANPDLQTSK